MRLIDIGAGNMVLDQRIVAMVTPDSAPAKRIVGEAKEQGRIIDCTGGRKTKSIIITDSDHVILSYLSCEALSERLNKDNGGTK
ncbi:MAG: DUF370 domain-containing protein [Clostridia bacterium]|nr:DUF370 domain-containing protein [Clostridia bacterium]